MNNELNKYLCSLDTGKCIILETSSFKSDVLDWEHYSTEGAHRIIRVLDGRSQILNRVNPNRDVRLDVSDYVIYHGDIHTDMKELKLLLLITGY